MTHDAGLSMAGRFAPLVVATATFVVLLAVLSAQPAGVFWDDGVYLITARALADGEGYRFVHLPGAPSAVHYPPLWPIVLAGVWKLVPAFPDNLAVFRAVNPLLAAIAAGFVCSFGTRALRLPWPVALAGTLVFATVLPVLVLDSVLFAEPLFLVCVVLSLLAVTRAERTGFARDAVVAGALAGAASLARSTGIVLVPAIAVALLLARRPRAAGIAFATGVAMVAPWIWWSATHAAELAPPLAGSYGPYTPWLANAIRERGAEFVAAVAARNAVTFERAVAAVFFPIGLREIRPLLVALLAVVAGLGALTAWPRARAACLFGIGYAALVLVWPYAPDRFAWAVWPLAGLAVAAGAHAAWRLAASAQPPAVRATGAALVVVALVAMAGSVTYTIRGVSRGWVDVAQRRNAARLRPIVEWVRANTPPDAIVATEGEPLVHLYTRRRVVPVHILSPDEYLAGTPLDQAADDLRALVAAGGADVVVLAGRSLELAAAGQLGPGTDSPRLVPLDTLPGGGVAFRVDRSP